MTLTLREHFARACLLIGFGAIAAGIGAAAGAALVYLAMIDGFLILAGSVTAAFLAVRAFSITYRKG